MRLTVDLAPRRAGGLRLRHPLIVAAGGAGYGAELLEAVGAQVPGAVITRSVTREARRGHPAPRLRSLPGGLLSSVGLPNPGLEAVLRRQAPRWAGFDVPVIVSICGEDVDDIGELARTLEIQPDAAGLELNLACPDRGRAGEPIGLDVEASEVATVAARAATDLPLIVKLTAAAPDMRAIARAVAAAGADAISTTSALPAIALDDQASGPALGTAYGGLSGPAIKPIGLRAVWEVVQVVRVPVIGIGGVHSLRDVVDYLAAGATAVGLATAVLADPFRPGRLARELEAWGAEHGLERVDQLVGRALPSRRDRGSLRTGPFRH
jgi:dihydroorotate dehydrogenase (NAD+) catalytic subunit